ncbi:hypothetical protein [Nitrosococcus oceani]|uniref:hypothetical protein n=1 Tax=Nitrosococcus oceani TaxID=1229 RepID=UPI00055B1249|nr:hypothetical protein [Nitrosococcus oceani]GEM20864.1 hypothetical protein NONS58_22870 [Nitrosococcus oceani]
MTVNAHFDLISGENSKKYETIECHTCGVNAFLPYYCLSGFAADLGFAQPKVAMNVLRLPVKQRQIEAKDIQNIDLITQKIPVKLFKFDISKALGIAVTRIADSIFCN